MHQPIKEIAKTIQQLVNETRGSGFGGELTTDELFSIITVWANGVDERIAQLLNSGVLPDHQIEKLAQSSNLIEPFDAKQINPASYDVCLGDHYIKNGAVHYLGEYHPLIIHQNEFILTETKEIFNLPNDICAQFALKSSHARLGLEHAMAGFCDPGWNGSRLTMELTNLSPIPVRIEQGGRIGQMIFMRMASPCRVSYAITGHYNNDKRVTESKL